MLVRPHKHKDRKGKKEKRTDKNAGGLLGFSDTSSRIETSTPKKGAGEDDTEATEGK